MTQKQWTANQRKFMEWLATPSCDREIKTQQEFAEYIGVHFVTLTKWKKKDGFMEESVTMAREQFRESMTDIFKAHIRKAKEGDVPAIRLAYEMAGEMGQDGDFEHVVKVKLYKGVDPDDWPE